MTANVDSAPLAGSAVTSRACVCGFVTVRAAAHERTTLTVQDVKFSVCSVLQIDERKTIYQGSGLANQKHIPTSYFFCKNILRSSLEESKTPSAREGRFAIERLTRRSLTDTAPCWRGGRGDRTRRRCRGRRRQADRQGRRPTARAAKPGRSESAVTGRIVKHTRPVFLRFAKLR